MAVEVAKWCGGGDGALKADRRGFGSVLGCVARTERWPCVWMKKWVKEEEEVEVGFCWRKCRFRERSRSGLRIHAIGSPKKEDTFWKKNKRKKGGLTICVTVAFEELGWGEFFPFLGDSIFQILLELLT